MIYRETEIVIDLETFGIPEGGPVPVISIGAVAVGFCEENRGESEIVSTFCANISLEDEVDHGAPIQAGTVMWWLSQSDEARKALTERNRETGIQVLDQFSSWYSEVAGLNVWGNGSDFDNVLLMSAYRRRGKKEPWGFRSNRCLRTLWNEYPEVSVASNGTAHSALDDAKRQAEVLRKIRRIQSRERKYQWDV